VGLLLSSAICACLDHWIYKGWISRIPTISGWGQSWNWLFSVIVFVAVAVAVPNRKEIKHYTTNLFAVKDLQPLSGRCAVTIDAF
jgi:hypothetical protein